MNRPGFYLPGAVPLHRFLSCCFFFFIPSIIEACFFELCESILFGVPELYVGETPGQTVDLQRHHLLLRHRFFISPFLPFFFHLAPLLSLCSVLVFSSILLVQYVRNHLLCSCNGLESIGRHSPLASGCVVRALSAGVLLILSLPLSLT